MNLSGVLRVDGTVLGVRTITVEPRAARQREDGSTIAARDGFSYKEADVMTAAAEYGGEVQLAAGGVLRITVPDDFAGVEPGQTVSLYCTAYVGWREYRGKFSPQASFRAAAHVQDVHRASGGAIKAAS